MSIDEAIEALRGYMREFSLIIPRPALRERALDLAVALDHGLDLPICAYLPSPGGMILFVVVEWSDDGPMIRLFAGPKEL